MTTGRSDANEDASRKPGMRAARRVGVKYPARGPGAKLHKKWARGHDALNNAMEEAGEALVKRGIKPTIPAALAELRRLEVQLSVATAQRHSDALKPARALWETAHGRVPEWHRSFKSNDAEGQNRVAEPNDEEIAAKLAICQNEVNDWRMRFNRKSDGHDALKKANELLKRENLELKEQVRRLELTLTKGG